MSRWVRCSYGKRAGFVGAKISIISESSKYFETFLLFFTQKVVSQAFFLKGSVQRPSVEGLFYILLRKELKEWYIRNTAYNYAAASAANMAATTQIMTLGKMMSDDKKTISQGYLKLTTIHPEEGIIGYMNIKHRKGVCMTVNIPIEGQIFSFDWDIAKKKKE